MTAVFVLGRLLMAAIFLFSGVMKVIQYSGQVAYAQQASVPLPQIAVALAAAIEIGTGVCLVFGYRLWSTAWVLIAYLVPVTIIFHSNFSDPNQTFHFMKNLAMIGGFLILAWSQRVLAIRRMPGAVAEAERLEVHHNVPL